MVETICLPETTEMLQAIEDIRRLIVEWHERIARDGLPALRLFQDTIMDVYRRDGAIYGDTPDGMLRWLREGLP